MNNKKIAVFDSGVGGLTCVDYLRKLLPNEDIVFFGDTKNIPYGTKTKEELQVILKRIIEYFNNLDVKLIVIACNTAGTEINYLKSISNIPLLEPISCASKAVTNKIDKGSNILVLATKKTCDSKVYSNNLNNYNVLDVPSPLLVMDAEENKHVFKHVYDYVMNYKEYANDISCVILGCTHFGYFKEEVSMILPNATIIESSYELALSAKDYIINNKLENDKNHNGTYKRIYDI